MIIESKAPTRIDLAGGTVDIWPLYLLIGNALTINVGIDLFAQARVEITSPPAGQKAGVVLESQDQNSHTRLEWKDLESQVQKLGPGLILAGKLIAYFSQLKRDSKSGLNTDLDLRLKSSALSPAGAGLGGSSTLAIAMIGALTSWLKDGGRVDTAVEGEKLIEIARDIETTLIRVPAGLQDYYGAMYGGLQKLQWGVAGHQHRSLSEATLPELQKRILLFYSGHSRNSGINNWALFKSLIDGDPGIRSRFDAIQAATRNLETSLLGQNWLGVHSDISAEWEARRGLAAGISTPEMDQAFKIAKEKYDSCGKICGAGGGGCFFIFESTGDPGKSEKIRKDLTQIPGVRSLPAGLVAGGLSVQVTS